MKHIKTGRGVRGLAVAAGVICLLLSSLAFAPLVTFKRATGVVHFYDTTERGQAVRRPSIHYTRHTGVRWGHTPQLDEISPSWAEGDTVTILYAAYGKTSLVASPRRWVYPITPLVVGALLLVFARFVFYCAPRNNSQTGVPRYAA